MCCIYSAFPAIAGLHCSLFSYYTNRNSYANAWVKQKRSTFNAKHGWRKIYEPGKPVEKSTNAGLLSMISFFAHNQIPHCRYQAIAVRGKLDRCEVSHASCSSLCTPEIQAQRLQETGTQRGEATNDFSNSRCFAS